jgi:hypothetical protein
MLRKGNWTMRFILAAVCVASLSLASCSPAPQGDDDEQEEGDREGGEDG